MGTKSNLRFDTQKFQDVNEKLDQINLVLSKPINPLEELQPYVSKLLSEIPESIIKQHLPDEYVDFDDFDIVLSDSIMGGNLFELAYNPSYELDNLITAIEDILPMNIIQTVLDTPFYNAKDLLMELPADLRATIAAITVLIQTNTHNYTFLEWIAVQLVGNVWHNFPSMKSDEIKLCGLLKRHKKSNYYWVVVSPEDKVTLYNPADLMIVNEFVVDRIDSSRSGHSLRFWKDGKVVLRISVGIDDELREIWTSNDPPFYQSMGYYSPLIPDVVLDAFKNALISPDTFFLRAIVSQDVMPLKDALTGMENLLTVFSAEGHVHRFFQAVVSFEFTTAVLSESTILRSNTPLTSLFKVIYNKYGQCFYDHVIKPMVELVLKEQINIKTDFDKVPQIEKLLDDGLSIFLGGYDYLPPQFKHMCYVLKEAISVCLRTRHCVYNALTSFLYLRFTTATISDPGKFEPGLELTMPQRQYLIQFAQLIQLPFNLQSVEKYEHLKPMAARAVDKYEDIYNFAMDAATLTEEPVYEKPPEAEVKKALMGLMELVSKSKGHFEHRYRELAEHDYDRSGPGIPFAEFLTRLFV